LLQNVTPPSNHALLFSLGHIGTHADGRVKCRNSRAESAHALAQDALRHQLQVNFTRVELLLEICRAGSGKRRHHVAYLVILEKNPQLAVTGSAIIADGPKISRAAPGQGLN
jgi:hypothetical protein